MHGKYEVIYLYRVSKRSRILVIIVLSQFAGTSLWFAGNAVVKDLTAELGLRADATGAITSAVQVGFITGTLLFAVLTLADRFSPSRLFLLSTLAGATANLCLLWAYNLPMALASRFVTGFFLAGIYPVGMKIATDYHDKGLGKALGWLVGALVLGTAFPHLLNGLKAGLNWHYVIVAVSLMAVTGGISLWLFVPDGPYRSNGAQPDLRLAFRLFANKDFRSVTLAYFGHMWELYTFWAWVPVLVAQYLMLHPEADLNSSVFSFVIIAIGSLSCVAGGHIALRKGSATTAFVALLVSCICCASAFFCLQLSLGPFILYMLIWGMAVIADSPQFTTLIAQSVPAWQRGTALTIATSMGFAITIASIQFTTWLATQAGLQNVFFILAIGPALGLLSIWKKIK